ncbi:MAG: aspartate kinase [Acidobacteria bacterium]|nr:aspartate kinase [Acidobacteriota bacterium]MCB9397966.1 aspartate kinase [Acidobacteriota bacterium]
MNEHYPRRTGWIVLKFGGTSVANVRNWPEIARTVEAHLRAGQHPLLVLSALAGTTNRLHALIESWEAGQPTQPHIDHIESLHQTWCQEIGLLGNHLIGQGLDAIKANLVGSKPGMPLPAPTKAKIMSTGEWLSTQMAAAWLQQTGLPTAWVDARELLHTKSQAQHSQAYLSAECDFSPNPSLRSRYEALGPTVLVTQGFLAANAQGETALLGRGGSDTSASYLASIFSADRLEIWTDVPGIFTSNPQAFPDARLLLNLDYDEAERLAAMGARVLHPRCIGPVREHQIPLHIRCTQDPELPTTVIGHSAEAAFEGVKAVLSRSQLGYGEMRAQRPGDPQFVTRSLAGLEAHDIAWDHMAFSQEHLRFTIDPTLNPLEPEEREALERHFQHFAEGQIRWNKASLSLVGKSLRNRLPEISPLMEVMQGQKVYMVSNTPEDMDLTLVLDSQEIKDVTARVHDSLLAQNLPDHVFGPAWSDLKSLPVPVRVAV